MVWTTSEGHMEDSRKPTAAGPPDLSAHSYLYLKSLSWPGKKAGIIQNSRDFDHSLPPIVRYCKHKTSPLLLEFPWMESQEYSKASAAQKDSQFHHILNRFSSALSLSESYNCSIRKSSDYQSSQGFNRRPALPLDEYSKREPLGAILR